MASSPIYRTVVVPDDGDPMLPDEVGTCGPKMLVFEATMTLLDEEEVIDC